MDLTSFVDLLIYPLKKLFILLGQIQIFGISLLAFITSALVLAVIFTFFVGMHSIGDPGSFAKRTNERAEEVASGTITKYHHGEGD